MIKHLHKDWYTVYISLVEQGLSQRKIAKEMGIHRTTLQHWLKHPDNVEDMPQEKIKQSVDDMIAKAALWEVHKEYERKHCKEAKVENTEHENQRILTISDMHVPYHHKDMLPFLAYLKAKYKPTRVISLGDECFPPDVEVLTDDGFVRFDELKETQLVAQWDEWSVSFVQPERYIEKDYSGNLLEYKHKTMTSRTTPKHNLVKIHPTHKTVHKREAWDSGGNESWHIPRNGSYSGGDNKLSLVDIQLLVAFQADGTFTKGAARFMFKKERKIEKLLGLLDKANIAFNTHTVQREGCSQFYIEKANVPEYFTKSFSDIPLVTLSKEQRETFLRELQFWDGTTTAQGKAFRYSSSVKANVEYVQAMATITGYVSSKVKPSNGECSCWMVDVAWNRENCSFKSAIKALIPYNGKVYCVTVPSGAIIVRTDGHIHVSGNCDKHALSYHDSDPDLASAGDELVKALPIIAELYKLFPQMDILASNHGSLVWRKAKTHGIPRHYIKSYNEVLGVGNGWKWHDDLVIKLPNGNSCYLHHGKSTRGLTLSQQMGMCSVQGHFHFSFNVEYFGTPLSLNWAMQAGCLIDSKSYAFSYANVNIKRPIVGTGLIINSHPVLVPLLMDENGSWIKPSDYDEVMRGQT